MVWDPEGVPREVHGHAAAQGEGPIGTPAGDQEGDLIQVRAALMVWWSNRDICTNRNQGQLVPVPPIGETIPTERPQFALNLGDNSQ